MPATTLDVYITKLTMEKRSVAKEPPGPYAESVMAMRKVSGWDETDLCTIIAHLLYDLDRQQVEEMEGEIIKLVVRNRRIVKDVIIGRRIPRTTRYEKWKFDKDYILSVDGTQGQIGWVRCFSNGITKIEDEDD
jgi:hypothetical protein